MTQEHENTSAFRGARFISADLTGARFVDCDLSQIKVTDSWLKDVNVSGVVANFVVNEVDVTAFVEGELDRRHPERVQLRAMATPDDHRAMWGGIERMWAETYARVRRLPESTRQERVDGEWSFVETLRHLVFATDAWIGCSVLDGASPYHRLGLTFHGYPPENAAALGLELAAQPSFEDMLAVRAGRMATVRQIVDDLTEDELERTCSQPPAPGYPEEPHTVGQCLRVVMREECEHRRYALRDLAVLEART